MLFHYLFLLLVFPFVLRRHALYRCLVHGLTDETKLRTGTPLWHVFSVWGPLTPDAYSMELGSVTLKRIGFFCVPIKHSTHTRIAWDFRLEKKAYFFEVVYFEISGMFLLEFSRFEGRDPGLANRGTRYLVTGRLTQKEDPGEEEEEAVA